MYPRGRTGKGQAAEGDDEPAAGSFGVLFHVGASDQDADRRAEAFDGRGDERVS